MTHRRISTDATLISLELRFLVDRAIHFKCSGRPDLAEAFVRAAEALVRSSLPEVAHAIALVASRKGQGETIAVRMIPFLSPTAAAAVFVIWSFRGARQPAIRRLVDAFAAHPAYSETVRLLCHRLFTVKTRPTSIPAIEVASPRSR